MAQLALLATLGVALLLGFSQPVLADHDQIVRVRFLGWSARNPETYLIYTIDEDRGNRLEIHEVTKPTSVLSVSAPESSARNILETEQFANWSFDYESFKKTQGLDAPNGWRLSGREDGSLFNILLSNGKTSVVLGSIRRKPTGDAGFASAKISDAYWSSDSAQVVVIVTHVKKGSWGLDVDEAYGFKLGGGGEADKGDDKDAKSTKKK
ncbi:MAG: hypothetical protein CMH57_08315 [Myxococcales bacterium]|nr:hypothetical protein [Myxococcales bacterium]